MSKYEPLRAFLRAQKHVEIPMRFAEIERVIDGKLPRSAYEHRPWWANEANGHVHARAWLEAGFETAQVDMEGKRLVFRRAGTRMKTGFGEGQHMYAHEHPKDVKSHPAVGSMKGLVTIAPGVDLNAPLHSDQEWDAIMKEWESNWDALGFKKIE